jgi:DNA-binding HxlR family transcriptional regulator
MEEANDVIILSAISKGAKKFDKIEKVTKITGKELNDMLERLEKKGMITIIEKKGLFGTKKEIVLTQKGIKELEERKFELEKEWGQMVTMWKGGDKQKLQQYMENKKSLLPSMMFMGIMDILMFSTMMSFMGMAMSSYIPQEQIPADAGNNADSSTDSGDTGSDFSGDGGGGFDIDVGF